MTKFFLTVFLLSVLLLTACGGVADVSETASAQSEDSAAVSETFSGGESNAISSDAESSEPSSETSFEESDGAISEPGEESTGEQTGESSKPGNAVSISSINREKNALNIAKGKTYTCSATAEEQYADNGTKLTDGVLVSSFNKEDWAGFIKVSEIQIVLDLGKTENGLADFSVNVLRYKAYGIGSAEHVLYEISDDGKNYTKIGRVYAASDISDVSSLGYKLKLAEPVSARYVRFTVTGNDSTWLFLGELEVIQYTDEEVSYYGDATLPTVGEPSYWPENTADGNKTVNLISGMIPKIQSKEPIADDFATEYYNSLKVLSFLTDGNFAKQATYTDSALVHFTRSSERTLLFDLGYTSAVSGVLYSFLNEESTGVCAPNTFSVYLSEDGIGWQRVYSEKAAPNSAKTLYTVNSEFDKVYRARFVKIVFSVGSHAFCDEVQIFGTKLIPKDAVSIIPTKEEETVKKGYITPEDFLDVHNVLLSYHCLEENGQHTESGLITVEEYLPHVGYYDQSGTLTDTFFDGFLYLPYTRFNYDDYARTLDGWKFYLDDIYTKDRNMDALNQAVDIVKEELNIPDYQVTVFTSVLYPWKKLSDENTLNTFGDLDGDGKNESFNSLSNRKKAVQWMMDQEYQRFLDGGYENLVFGGFYWFEEAISVGDAEEKELIQFAADYAHSLGLKLFWIPYYCASGYDRWEEYGFDLACMQPNYMFGNSGNASALETTAEKTSELGMCVEIEMNSVTNSDEVQRYMEYLAAGVQYGYMHAVKMYYQSGVPGVVYDAYISEDPYRRAVYDYTYLFAKEKLTLQTPTYVANQLDYVCKDGAVSGETIVTAEGVYRYRLAVSPSHGGLKLNEDGSFVYYPDEGYTGEDRFAVVLDYGYTVSEEIVVTVTVD